MSPLPPFVRAAPTIFYAIGVIDFAKNIVPLFNYFVSGNFRPVDYSTDVHPQLFALFLSAMIYASGWVAYGVFAKILLSIHDHLQGLRMAAEVAALGRQGGQDA